MPARVVSPEMDVFPQVEGRLLLAGLLLWLYMWGWGASARVQQALA